MSKKINVHAEEASFVVIEKPIALGMHDDDDPGLDSRIRHQLDDSQLCPAHRLDKETSGLLLVAKGKAALTDLSLLFQQRKIDKYYWAIASGKPKKKQGTVDGGMAKSRNGCWKLTRSKENRAITQFFSYGLGAGRRAFLVKPYSGRTHQIRVALKSLGSPLLGDLRYSGLAADRMYLHATQLKFAYRGRSFQFDSLPQNGEFFQAVPFQSLCAQMPPYSELGWPVISVGASHE